MLNFIIDFKVLMNYYGEFGFDWVDDETTKGNANPRICIQNTNIANLEYIYDEQQNVYIEVEQNKDLQQKLLEEYKTFKINNDTTYYIPYLNIFPNQEIELKMLFTILNDTDISKEVVTFEANDAYLVTIDGKTNENIKYTPSGRPKKLSIKCIKPSAETDIIAKDGHHNIVGKIRVKNNTTTYNLDIRVVCVVKDTPKKDAEIDQLLEDFQYLRIEEYLNKYSLNQALIKTKVEIDKKYHLAFNENDMDEIVAYLMEENSHNSNALFSRLLKEYQNQFETGREKFKGVFIFLNYIDFPNTTATSLGLAREVDSNEIIIFKDGLFDKPTYAHEIGHAIGLQHPFLHRHELVDVMVKKQQFEELMNEVDKHTKSIEHKTENLAETQQSIDEYQDKIDKLKLPENQDDPDITVRIEYLEKRINKAKLENTERQNAIDRDTKELLQDKKVLAKIKKDFEVLQQNKYKFQQGTTYNIMDYVNTKNTFTHWQWQIMQDNIKNAKGNAT